ncbi:MAG TPA: site-specific integrase [Roseiarcus sp.]|jgi:integrase
MKFTIDRIKDLKGPVGKKDALFFDEEQSGLGVRVMHGAKKGNMGGKSYLAQYSYAGQKRRVPLGACSAITLAAARDAVKVILGDVAKGRDPAAERKEAKRKAKVEALTLDDLIGQWDKLHLADKRPNYAAAATSALRRAFAKHLSDPAVKLGRDTVVRILDGLAQDDKAAMASATARYGSALFGWAARRGSLSANPFEHVPTAPAVRRDRVLSDDEIRLVWAATEEPGAFNAIVRALLLTGQRREEVSALTWAEIDEVISGWTLSGARTKNGKPHLVPLSEQMRALLRAQPRREGTDLVFPGEKGVFSGWSKSKARLDQDIAARLRKNAEEQGLDPSEVRTLDGWTLHDLRRTVATGLQKLGVRLEVTEAILNHVAGSRAGIVGVYQRHDWADEKRAALTAWGAHVEAILEKRAAPDNVTQLRRSA